MVRVLPANIALLQTHREKEHSMVVWEVGGTKRTKQGTGTAPILWNHGQLYFWPNIWWFHTVRWFCSLALYKQQPSHKTVTSHTALLIHLGKTWATAPLLNQFYFIFHLSFFQAHSKVWIPLFFPGQEWSNRGILRAVPSTLPATGQQVLGMLKQYHLLSRETLWLPVVDLESFGLSFCTEYLSLPS